MASAHDIEMAARSHPDPETDKEPRLAMTGERSRLALAGFWLALAVLAVVVGALYLAIVSRGHTPAIRPGQPQAPAAAAVLNGKP